MSADGFCCEEARREGDQLGGTASQVDLWLLLEHPGPWGRGAVADAELPGPVARWWQGQLRALPRTKGLFVRRGAASAASPPRLYVAVTQAADTRLHRFDGAELADLVTVDAAAVASHPHRYQASRCRQRLLLVCTNGRHDRCCARYGAPLFQALRRELEEEAVWESTHLGGHRYAATAVCLPEGVAYGLLEAGDAPRLAAAWRRRELLLSHLRGRCALPRPAQAAEAWLRERQGLTGLEDLSRVTSELRGSGHWRVTLFERASGAEHVVEVEERRHLALVSCSKEKRREVVRWSCGWREPRG